MLLGAGLGLTAVSPWAGSGASLTTIAVSTAIWLVVVQWLSSGLGGYLTGRLRTKWVAVHTDEVFFRDTAHGFLAWALATLLIVGVMGSALSSVLGTAVQATATVTSGAALGATSNVQREDATSASGYFVDLLFRPADPARLSATGAEGQQASTAEATRILASSAVGGEMTQDDKTYLAQLVAARTGLSEADAQARVDGVLQRINDAKTKAKEAADAARKAGITFSLLSALSLIIGAFIASVAAAYGGRQRDEEEDLLMVQH